HQKSGPFPQPALPGFDGHTTPSDSRHGRRLRDVEAATLARDGSPPMMPRSRAQIDRSAIGPDAPLRLDVAAAIAFPDGSMTVSGLRNENRKGRLIFELIAGKQYVTLASIERMRQECRDAPKVPASTTANAAAAKPSGSSSTERMKSAQAAAQAIANELKKPSPITSAKSTDPTGKILTLQR
ncbi:MAG: hypothetical protein WBF73_27100, partial [Bradyrhizobium sp.]